MIHSIKRYFIVNIAAGRWHNLVLTSDRICFTWGAGHFGQLGLDGLDTKGIPVPQTLNPKPLILNSTDWIPRASWYPKP